MSSTEILAQFSRNRLDGEPVPDDLKILLPHRDELAERSGIRLEWAEGWAPWSDTTYLTDADRSNPDIMANVRAIQEVCGYIAFVAAGQNEQFFGYWRGPGRRKVARSPLVVRDDEGQFHLCISSTLAEAILEKTYGRKGFDELRAWFESLGISIAWECPSQLTYPHEKIPPKELHRRFYETYRQQMLDSR
ncbi:MAG: hypothetical protein ACLQGP_34400 [Isosphaeraceae bacterium]